MGEEDVEGRENAARCFFSDKTAEQLAQSATLVPHDPQPPAVDRFKNYLLNLNYLKSKWLSLRERSASPTNQAILNISRLQIKICR